MKTFRSYKNINILLGLWLLLVSCGIDIDYHYCRGELSNIALFKKAKSCHDLKLNTCSAHATTSPESENTDDCCDNERTFIKLDSEHISLDYSTYFSQCPTLVSDINNIVYYKPRHTLISAFNNYRPPPLIFDFSITYQSFLL